MWHGVSMTTTSVSPTLNEPPSGIGSVQAGTESFFPPTTISLRPWRCSTRLHSSQFPMVGHERRRCNSEQTSGDFLLRSNKPLMCMLSLRDSCRKILSLRALRQLSLFLACSHLPRDRDGGASSECG